MSRTGFGLFSEGCSWPTRLGRKADSSLRWEWRMPRLRVRDDEQVEAAISTGGTHARARVPHHPFSNLYGTYQVAVCSSEWGVRHNGVAGAQPLGQSGSELGLDLDGSLRRFALHARRLRGVDPSGGSGKRIQWPAAVSGKQVARELKPARNDTHTCFWSG